MPILEQLAPQHDEWMAMARNITKNNDAAEELLQEFYINIAAKDQKNKIMLWPDNYRSYIKTSLKNLHSDRNKAKYKEQCNVIPFSDITATSYIMENELTGAEEWFNNHPDSTEEYDEKMAFESLYSKVEDFLNQKYKGVTLNYKVGLLKLNTLEKMSMREISEATGISKRTVQLSIESVRKIIREKYEKDFQDYKNR